MKLFVYVILILFLYNCKQNESKYNFSLPKKVKNDTIEFFFNIEIERRYHGITNGIIAENDSIFYISSDTTYINPREVFINGKKISDSTLSYSDLKKRYQLKKIDVKDFIKVHNFFEKKVNCGWVNAKESFNNVESKISILKSKKGNIYKYSDIQGKPYNLKICVKDKIYNYNLRIQILREDLDNGYIGFGITTSKLYDVDKDGKEELLVIKDTADGIIIYVFKINYIEN